MNKKEFKELVSVFQEFSKLSQKANGYAVSQTDKQLQLALEKNLAIYSAFDQYCYLVADTTKLKFVKIGGAFKQMTGYDANDFEGKSYHVLLKIHSLKDLIKSALGGSKYFNYLYQQPPHNRQFIKAVRTVDITCKNGKQIHCLAQSIPLVFNDKMAPVFFLNIITDLASIKLEKTYNHYIVDASDNSHIKTIPITFFKKVHKNSNSILSKAEINVLKFLASGSSSKEIADKLNISEHTVKNHRKNMLKKYECHSSAELVKKALADGIL